MLFVVNDNASGNGNIVNNYTIPHSMWELTKKFIEDLNEKVEELKEKLKGLEEENRWLKETYGSETRTID